MHTPSHSTYAFEDLAVVFSHPAKGSLTLTGAGIVSATVTRSTDVSTHDLAADGSVMTSKIQARNGTITLVVQQTSDGAKWLRKLNEYLEVAASTEWTQAVCSISSKVQGVDISCTGVSPQKTPDAAYQAQGQQVSFAYLCQTITGV
jgi:hypothetical protein